MKESENSQNPKMRNFDNPKIRKCEISKTADPRKQRIRESEESENAKNPRIRRI